MVVVKAGGQHTAAFQVQTAARRQPFTTDFSGKGQLVALNIRWHREQREESGSEGSVIFWYSRRAKASLIRREPTVWSRVTSFVSRWPKGTMTVGGADAPYFYARFNLWRCRGCDGNRVGGSRRDHAGSNRSRDADRWRRYHHYGDYHRRDVGTLM